MKTPTMTSFLFASAWLLALGVSPTAREPLSFAERVKAQEAIERVYYAHRIWPKENPLPKPPFEATVPRAVLEARVTDYLGKCAALDKYWQRPIRTEQLQAEMDRMARDTKDPETLRDLFAALDNDPYRIAECLARPVLAERLLQNGYAWDAGLHAEVRAQAERALAEITPKTFEAYPLGELRRMTYRRERPGVFRGDAGKAEGGSTLFMDTEEFERVRERLPEAGAVGFQELPDGFLLTLPLLVSEGEIATVTRFFAKKPLDEWWKGEAPSLDFAPGMTPEAEGTAFQAPQVLASCEDVWGPGNLGSTGLPEERSMHTAVWTGTEMIVWGGYDGSNYLNTGGRYNPSTDTWAATSTGWTCPSGRANHTAVWTGSEMIAWGGETDSVAYAYTGGRYNPSTDTWAPVFSGGESPPGRAYHTAVWTGTEMVIWGGVPAAGQLTNTGGRYDPSTDSWVPTSVGTGCPSAGALHTAVWTGTEMIVWGGYGDNPSLIRGGRYLPSSDRWLPLSEGANCPPARYHHTAVWTGSEMIVWGGVNINNLCFDDGGRYNPSTDTWEPTSVGVNCPAARFDHTSVWTGTEMIVWGGRNQEGGYFNTGGRYNPATGTWISTPAGANCAEGRFGQSAVWTGTEMIVWGGETPWARLNSGGRFNPAADSWIPTSSAGAEVPSGRYNHTAVWTGAEMIVWGGVAGYHCYKTGGRYSPSTDSWTPTSTGENAPVGRESHTAVWTGTEMIVWGGGESSIWFDTGGRYNPTTDSWIPTSTGTGVPSKRYGHTVVWTGREMIVWGGRSYPDSLGTGGRYDPSSDSWTPTSAGAGAPSARSNHTAIWTGIEMVVWGGQDADMNLLATGGRYNPAEDSWIPTSVQDQTPSMRLLHTAVWTGSKMIVWGGENRHINIDTGGQYDPAVDSWTPTSTGAGAPSGRSGHSAVWTGNEMVVWGGTLESALIDTGGRYTPAADSWIPTPSAGDLPSARSLHTAVWTGRSMLVWGGWNNGLLNSGGIFSPCPCTLACGASGNPPAGTVPLAVSFAGSAIPANCTGHPEYSWNFGDGQVSSLQNPTHTYTSVGTFLWTLTTTMDGQTSTCSGEVVVACNPPAVSYVVKKGSPFRLKIATILDLSDGWKVFLADQAAPWAKVTQQGTREFTLKGAGALFKKDGSETLIRIVNGDGCAYSIAYNRKAMTWRPVP